MAKSWLMLRGEYDQNNEHCLLNDSDVWVQLFAHMVGKDNGCIWYLSDKQENFKHRYISDANNFNHLDIETSPYPTMDLKKFDYVFARGAFFYYYPILIDCQNAYNIRYSAGKRFIPKEKCYDLILCDSENQKRQIVEATEYTNDNTKLFIKPAAKCFKPIECKKEYDVCYIANESQGHFKGIQWVYDTVPKDLKVLHLGNFTGKYHAPENVTRKHVDRIDMPKWINKCRVGIVPYWNQIDSCPRIIPEMLACGLHLVIASELNFWDTKYYFATDFYGTKNNPIHMLTESGTVIPSSRRSMLYTNLNRVRKKEKFWPSVQLKLFTHYDGYESACNPCQKEFVKYYQENLSIPVAAKYIKDLINEK